jgi:hypothetical protein
MARNKDLSSEKRKSHISDWPITSKEMGKRTQTLDRDMSFSLQLCVEGQHPESPLHCFFMLVFSHLYLTK